MPFAHHLERYLLQVQDDVGSVFDDARNGAEFVIHAFDADGGDGGAFDARKEHAAERVADSGAETALERLGGELPVAFRQRLSVGDQTFGFLKALEHTFVFTPITAWLYLNPRRPVFTAQTAVLTVQFDDQLFVDRDLHQFVAPRAADDPALQIFAIHVHPAGRGAWAVASRADRMVALFLLDSRTAISSLGLTMNEGY